MKQKKIKSSAGFDSVFKFPSIKLSASIAAADGKSSKVSALFLFKLEDSEL